MGSLEGGLDLTVGPLGLGFWALFSSEVSLTGNDGFSSSEKVYRNYLFCFTMCVVKQTEHNKMCSFTNQPRLFFNYQAAKNIAEFRVSEFSGKFLPYSK